MVNRFHGDSGAGTGDITTIAAAGVVMPTRRRRGHSRCPQDSGRRPRPRRPGLGPAGTATVHGDAASPTHTRSRARCECGRPLVAHQCDLPTVFIGSDGMPVALCTAYVGLNPPTPLAPTVALPSRHRGCVKEVQLTKGALLGGVYGYSTIGPGRGRGRDPPPGVSMSAPGGPRRMTVGCCRSLPGCARGRTGLMPASTA